MVVRHVIWQLCVKSKFANKVFVSTKELCLMENAPASRITMEAVVNIIVSRHESFF